jgi:hypothetical protein
MSRDEVSGQIGGGCGDHSDERDDGSEDGEAHDCLGSVRCEIVSRLGV